MLVVRKESMQIFDKWSLIIKFAFVVRKVWLKFVRTFIKLQEIIFLLIPLVTLNQILPIFVVNDN